MNQELQDSLEKLIDKHSLSEVLEAMSHICWEKAGHLEANWQDKVSADVWRKTGDRLQTQVGKVSGYGI